MKNDVKVLRELAMQYAAAAADHRNEDNLILHRNVNDLKMTRPVVLIDEHPWHELNHDGSLTLQCEDPFLRGYENHFRRTLYKWRYMPADMIISRELKVGKVVHSTPTGLEIDEKILAEGNGNHIVAHEYHDILKTEEDLDRIAMPVYTYDEAETKRKYQIIGDILGDLLPVRIAGSNPSIYLWDWLSQLRGVTSLLEDLVERPEFSHACAKKFAEINKSTFEQFEALNLLDAHPTYIHCTPATASDLPGEGFDGEHVRLKDIWGRGTAQIFGSVSPNMHDEFEIEYVKDILGQFGLVYYGCCEPLHNKIHIVEKIPNVRKIGCTPWADVDIAAERIGKKYVLSSKPNPANIARYDRDTVIKEITQTLDACRRNGCAVDITLKDISSGGGGPQNLMDWEKTVMALVRNY